MRLKQSYRNETYSIININACNCRRCFYLCTLVKNHTKVEMTNNLAERTVKPYVINRKNFLFSDTEKGADASAAVMSIIETAKRNTLDVYGYLLYLLTILPEPGNDPTETQLEAVMPWSMTLPAYCRQMYSKIH